MESSRPRPSIPPTNLAPGARPRSVSSCACPAQKCKAAIEAFAYDDAVDKHGMTSPRPRWFSGPEVVDLLAGSRGRRVPADLIVTQVARLAAAHKLVGRKGCVACNVQAPKYREQDQIQQVSRLFCSPETPCCSRRRTTTNCQWVEVLLWTFVDTNATASRSLRHVLRVHS